MKTRTKKSILLVLAIAVAAAIALLCTQVKTNKAFADEVDAQPLAGYIVSDATEYVDAEFEYIVLNATECSVRITNFDDVTRALIPEYAEIDGKMYTVTEIDDNGFMSSPNLVRVNLPDTIKRIGYSAFADCAKLNRINLANVQEIDDSAFEDCPELTEILIPESAQIIGTYIFWGNNTQVMVRAEADGDEWDDLWNSNNANKNVEYCSDYNHPIELETIYGTTARSANSIIGYAIASGQPRNENYYTIDGSWVEKSDRFRGSIFIPAEYDKKPVMKIADNAFKGVSFTQLIVEYAPENDAQELLTIGSNAFAGTQGESIVINRPVRFFNDDKNIETNNIFNRSSVQSIVLPNNVTKLVNSMFAGCKSLTNIFFTEPVNINFDYTDLDGYLDVEDNEELTIYLQNKANGVVDSGYEQDVTRLRELCIVKSLTDDSESGIVDIPGSSKVNAIGNNVFQGTTAISELHLYDTIQSVGSSILSGLDNNKQTVYVHIDNSDDAPESNYYNWNTKWKSNFTEVKELKTYYFITLDPDGGEFEDGSKDTITIRVKYGEEIGEFPKVTKLGFLPDGWMLEDGTEYTSSIYQEYRDITLTAKWNEIDYHIYFDMQGGVGGTEVAMVSMNRPLPDAVAPVKEGHTFNGYYTKEKGNGQVYYHYNMDKALNSWTHDGDLILYANWVPNVYTVKLHKGYGNDEAPRIINVAFMGDMLLNLQKPERHGYIFTGYYDDEESEDNQYYDENMGSNKQWNKAGDGDLYAHWIPITYTIYYNLAGGNSDGGNPTEYTVESTFTFKDATHDTLYFDGWVCNGKKVTSAKDLPGDNVTLKATWTDIKTISVTKAFSTLTVDVPKANVVMDCAFSSSCYIVFTSNVVTAMISGNGRVYNMCINITSRQTDFGLVLNNIGVVATSSFYTINMVSDQTLYLMTVGLVSIHGYSPTSGHGKAAISCHSLVIGTLENCEHVLTIYGGNGSDGVDGIDGTNGKNGSVAIIADTVITTCDYVTIEGGTGGNGGDSIMIINGKPYYGRGKKGYGGYGAKPISGEFYVTGNFSYVYLKNGKDGADGVGQESFRPINPDIPDYTEPTIKPWNPNLPITPPIGDIIPTSEPYVPHTTDV